MSGRPGEEYRVRARIEGRSGRRRWLALLAGAAVVVAWIGITLSSPGGGPRGPIGTPGTALGSGGADGTIRPTYPPVVQVLQPSVPMGQLAVILGGLAWLDPAHENLDRVVGQDVVQWPFAMADGGAACVCVSTATDLVAPTLHVYRFDRTGTMTFAQTYPDWLPRGDVPSLEDAILEPDGSGAIAAVAVQRSGTWHLRVQDLPFDESSPGPPSESDLDLAALGDPLRLNLRLAISPDGSRLRISVRPLSSGPADGATLGLAWVARRESGTWGPLRVVQRAGTARVTACGQEAWATATDYVSICLASSPNDVGQLPTFVEIDRGDGQVDVVNVGESAFQEPTGWLVDGSHGVVYGWTALSHQLYRIDVATGQLSQRLFFSPEGPAGSLLDTGTEATAPPAGAAPVLWRPIGSAAQPLDSPLVGSPDGTLLYATGLEFRRGLAAGGGPASTGIWVFDAASLAIVAHWQPVITYASIGLAAGGRLLVGVGSASADELRLFGNHGPALAVHLTTDGSVVAIDRELVLQLGGPVSLLPPG